MGGGVEVRWWCVFLQKHHETGNLFYYFFKCSFEPLLWNSHTLFVHKNDFLFGAFPVQIQDNVLLKTTTTTKQNTPQTKSFYLEESVIDFRIQRFAASIINSLRVVVDWNNIIATRNDRTGEGFVCGCVSTKIVSGGKTFPLTFKKIFFVRLISCDL